MTKNIESKNSIKHAMFLKINLSAYNTIIVSTHLFLETQHKTSLQMELISIV